MSEALGAGLGAAALAFAVVALVVGIRNGSAPATAGPAEHEFGRAVFARMGCGSCHTLAAAGSSGRIGPNLDERLGGHTRESLIARITAPQSGPDYFNVMPTDFGSRMTARELDSLVSFLLAGR